MTEQNEAAVETQENTTEPSSPEELFQPVIESAEAFAKQHEPYDFIGRLCAKGTTGIARQISAAFNYMYLIAFTIEARASGVKETEEDPKKSLDPIVLAAAKLAREKGKFINLPTLAIEKGGKSYRYLWNRMKREVSIWREANKDLPPNSMLLNEIYDAAICWIQKDKLQPSHTPSNYVVPNNKLSNVLPTQSKVENPEIPLVNISYRVINGQKKTSPINSTCMLDYTGVADKINTKLEITSFDRIVYNGITTLYVNGDPSHCYSAAQVFRVMNGLRNQESPSEAQLIAIRNSIEKMSAIRLSIKCKEEFERYGLNGDDGHYNANLIASESIDNVISGGHKVYVFKILQEPVLYKYSSKVKQVLTIDAAVLDIKEVANGNVGPRFPITENRLLIKNFLLLRVEGMKGKNKLESNKVLLNGENGSGLYSVVGDADNLSRIEKQRIRQDAETMLAYWKAIGYIKDFSVSKKGNRIDGYFIKVC